MKKALTRAMTAITSCMIMGCAVIGACVVANFVSGNNESKTTNKTKSESES